VPLGHYNIVLHCNRVPWIYPNPDYDPSKPEHFKFNNPKAVHLKSHDEALIENWNKMVKKGDTVYILGDFAFRDHNHYLMALNGKKIIILGNHDKASREVYKNFTEVHEFGCRKKIEGYDVTLCHYSMRSWPNSCHNSLHAYGHSHLRMPEFDNMLSGDVGVDGCGYGLWPWECYLEKMTQKINWAKENAKKIVDGEARADGQYSKDPEERVIETRKKNKEIFKKMGYPINELMWPNT
jgi:calcineurin-like phosphoesterase family protein